MGVKSTSFTQKGCRTYINMTIKCPTGKRAYPTEILAEEALVDAHSQNQYSGTGPVAVYRCDECGYFHFTSKGKMNERLAQLIASGKIKLQQQGADWERKLKK
ncbi:hypothetical protein WSM22_10350 [Cytophagales bacterium WSM2-2]|nr:hypothetical protein WSM22_10350 [Cytophagales bacterium WSM2-2]